MAPPAGSRLTVADECRVDRCRSSQEVADVLVNLGDEARILRAAKLVAVRQAHMTNLPADCFRVAVEVTNSVNLAVEEVITAELDVTESLRQHTTAVVFVVAATVVCLASVADTIRVAVEGKDMKALNEAVRVAVSPAMVKAAFVTVFSELSSGTTSKRSQPSVVFDCHTRSAAGALLLERHVVRLHKTILDLSRGKEPIVSSMQLIAEVLGKETVRGTRENAAVADGGL
ncbi:hypothetical protein BU14_0082s0039 [Porphyra umbilicalis]|uniref:Uncharacterized protein n=1 Tax=Porphyra umbilicalis TaxID=2786 RepID=A0A1X6PEJ6_PORUM|nr:hypothetical protein BU14_0082s0039 [Porphyra umbilicalis]|eukprot:OSX79274.1 hypothetical protein BU14_0082s0039 [Porphyra umbilicalis]